MSRPVVYFAVTNHGFGHAVRSASVVANIIELNPEILPILVTTAPRWLLDSYISGEYIQRPRAFDVGVIQSDSLTMDKLATKEKLEQIIAQSRSIIASEVNFIKTNRVGLVVADLPPLAALIAKSAGLPCWMIGNFGWDFIYRDWGEEFASISDWISRCSNQCDRLFKLPRPLLNSGDLNFSFSGLKTAVLSLVNKHQPLITTAKAELAWEFQEAITDVLSAKCMAALRETGLDNLVVSGGVGANLRLRQKLNAAVRAKLCKVSYPRLEFCTDNGAMIAFAGAMRLQAAKVDGGYGFSVKPRWDLAELLAP